jgi:type IV secretion system protein VirB11
MITTAQQARLRDLLTHNLGVLGDLLDDPSVLHISVTSAGLIFVERFGQAPQRETTTLSVAARDSVIRLVASQTGRVVTDAACRLATIMPDGERFQGFLPPVVNAPAFEIRKRATRIFTLGDYCTAGIMTERQAQTLEQSIHDSANIVVAGGTGSGKTTLLNAMIHALVDTGEHLVTVEDTPELQVRAAYWTALYTVPGQCTLTDLVADALRCNPRRIIVGEVRGPELLDVCDAWNTGHPGGMLSVHANSGQVPERLDSLLRRAHYRLDREDRHATLANTINLSVDILRTPGAPGRRLGAIMRWCGLSPDHTYKMEIIG